jgi:sulfopyruvate decarboxylase alpha subunit
MSMVPKRSMQASNACSTSSRDETSQRRVPELGRRRRRRRLVDVGDHHRRALGDVPAGDRPADPAPRAGHQRHLAFESPHDRLPSRPCARPALRSRTYRPCTLVGVAAPPVDALDWQREIAAALVETGVETVAYVPDARLRGIVAALEPHTRVRTLTREEECIGYACGFAAAGGRTAVLMQCSGLGNALNAIGSFALPYAIGIPIVLSMRGTLGETNPSQVPMGRATTALLDALGVQSFPVSEPAEAGRTMRGVLASAYEAGTTGALILEPSLGGRRESS